jgi:hypothetical protein
MSHARDVTEANLLKLKEINSGSERRGGWLCSESRLGDSATFGNPNGIKRGVNLCRSALAREGVGQSTYPSIDPLPSRANTVLSG